MDCTRTSSGYCPKSVAEAWKHRCEAFGEGDMDKLRLDYDKECLITSHNVLTNECYYYGLSWEGGGRRYLTGGVKDSSKTEELVS